MNVQSTAPAPRKPFTILNTYDTLGADIRLNRVRLEERRRTVEDLQICRRNVDEGVKRQAEIRAEIERKLIAHDDLVAVLRNAALSLEDMAKVHNICGRPVMAEACQVISTDIRRVLAKAGLE